MELPSEEQLVQPQMMPPSSSDALNPSFGQWVLSPRDDLEYLEHMLRGDAPTPSKEDPDETEWKEGVFEAVLTSQGTYEIMREMKMITSRITSLTLIKENQFYIDFGINANSICKFLYLNYRRFELEPSKYRQLCTCLVNIIEYSLAKARNKAMMEFVHPRYRGVEQTINQRVQMQREKTGWIGKFGL